jgi:plasmid stabilization system protein ParE
MFRHLEPGVIEVVRILHDSRDLGRHLPEAAG